MKKITSRIITIVSILSIALTLVSCSGNSATKIVVAASPKPHGDILSSKVVRDLLKEKGFTIQVKPYNDYIMPNQALSLKQVDANFFQHLPYLEQYNKENNTNIISLGEIHIEPIGIYSHPDNGYQTLADVKEGASVFISSSKSDHGRLLMLLASENLITLTPGVNAETATLQDIATNPKGLVIRADIDPTSLALAYRENQADLILINSNYALDANLNPGTDALALESANDNPFANILATLPDYKDLPKIKALLEVLTSKEVSDYILTTWNGDIVPVVSK